MAPDRVHFQPAAAIADATSAAFAATRAAVQELLGDAEIEEMGATSVPGSLTKGDLDLLVTVPADRFAAGVDTLRDSYAIHQPENWTPGFASFAADPIDGVPIGIQLVAAGSDDERDLRALGDLLRSHPELVERMNALKRSFEGADATDYWRAKQELIESLLAPGGAGRPGDPPT